MASAAVVQTRPVVSDTVPHNKLQYDKEKPMGSGTFATVYKTIYEDWGCLVAYKKLGIQYITEEKCIITLKNEAEIHRQLRHPNIVSMLGVVFEDYNYGLVLEYFAYGALDSFLDHIKELTGAPFRVSSMLKTKMSYEVCCGMSYLHSLSTPVIHGDLKIQNLLVGQHLNIKISDFGLSKWKDYSSTHTQPGIFQATPSHIPPEKWLNLNLRENEKFDVYSFGILEWELFTEAKAFEDCKQMIMSMVIGGIRPPLKKLPKDLAPAIEAQMKDCWQQNPVQRPASRELANKLKSLIHGPETETEIERSVRDVLEVYYECSESENGHKLKRLSQQLCESIRRIDKILNKLVEQRVVSQEGSESIRHNHPTAFVCAQRLIDLLASKPDTAYQCFRDALVATNQSHLSAFLNGEDADTNMDHREALIDNYTYLKANLNLKNQHLLDHLLQSHVLDEQEMREIQAGRTSDEEVDKLLQLIMRTSPEQYRQFLRDLQESGLTFIAEQLSIGNRALADHSPKVAMVKDKPKQRPEIVPASKQQRGLSVSKEVQKLQGETNDENVTPFTCCSTWFIGSTTKVLHEVQCTKTLLHEMNFSYLKQQ